MQKKKNVFIDTHPPQLGRLDPALNCGFNIPVRDSVTHAPRGEGTNPVSYTHLDVYKRQVSHRYIETTV